VTVSAPAPAALHVPAVSLATSLNAKDPGLASKDPNAARTVPFKNVFDSLTLPEELEDEPGAPQQGSAQEGAAQANATIPNSSRNQQLPDQSSTGTEETSVLQLPIIPAIVNRILTKAALIMNQPQHAVTPEKEDAAQEAPASDTTPLPSATKQAASIPGSASTTPARSAMQIDPIPAVTPPAPTIQLEAARPLVSQPSLPMSEVAKPSASESVSPLAEPLTAEPQAPAAKTLVTPGAGNVPIRVSSPALQPSATISAPKQGGAAAPKSQTGTVARMAMPTPQPPTEATKTYPTPTRASAAPAIEASTRPSPPTPQPTPVPVRVTAPVGDAHTIAPSVPVNEPAPVTNLAPVSNSTPVTNPTPVTAPAPMAGSSDSVQIATPSPIQQPDASNAPPANVALPIPPTTPPPIPLDSKEDRVPPTPSSVETKSQPALPPVEPVAQPHEVMDRTSAPQHDAPGIIPAPKISLVPQADNFAFAVRMLGQESSPKSALTPSTGVTQSQTPVTTNQSPAPQSSGPVTQPQSSDARQPAPEQTQTSSDPARDAAPAAPETDRAVANVQNALGSFAAQPTPGLTSHWNDAPVLQAPENGALNSTPEPAETGHANLPLASQETHLLTPELPKTSASSEILLHLTGSDQSSAAIRVADRAGSVSVSVHSSDPVLRESLRSNLGELSSQLNDQGWKADVSKSPAAATPSGSQQDSHEGGQRGSQQQQSSGGERQPQRDRRASGGQWQQELDQQISGGNAHSGGNG
jgi:hypothetical protein